MKNNEGGILFSRNGVKAHFSAELIFLLGLVVFLPSFEAPKTYCLLLFIAVIIYRQIREKRLNDVSFGDYLLISWILIGFLVALFSPFDHKEWGGAISAMLIPLLLLCLRRCAFSDKEISAIFYVAMLSTLLALAWGGWQLFMNYTSVLELNSVGHVNHTAIYLSLAYGMALAGVIHPNCTWRSRIFFMGMVSILWVSVIVASSRASLLAMFVITLSFLVFRFWGNKKGFFLCGFALSLIIFATYKVNPPIVSKTIGILDYKERIQELPRYKIWNTAFLAWENNPVFGVGLKNYSQINEDRIKGWLAKEGKVYDVSRYYPYAHGHSLFFNTLAEQGFVGVGIIFSVLIYFSFLLYKHKPYATDSPINWLLWLGAVGAIEVVVVNGLFNTTLHHEHGLLAVLLIGLWWSGVKRVLE